MSNVLFGRYKMISGQVRDYFYGLYGRPPGEVDPEVRQVALRDYDKGSEPTSAPPSELVEPEMEKAQEAVKELSTDIDDVLTYALYPTTGMRFLRIKHGQEPVPEEMAPPDEAPEETPAGAPAPRPASVPPRSRRSRLFNVYVGDDFYEVEVDPVNPSGAAVSPQAATPLTAPAQPVEAALPPPPPPVETRSIAAPMPGIVLRYVVEVGQKVTEGDPVVVLEAMKMENILPSPVEGVVNALPLQEGATVSTGDVLAAIAV